MPCERMVTGSSLSGTARAGSMCMTFEFVEWGGTAESRWLTFHRGGTFQLCTEKWADPKDEEQEVKSEA